MQQHYKISRVSVTRWWISPFRSCDVSGTINENRESKEHGWPEVRLGQSSHTKWLPLTHDIGKWSEWVNV